MTDLAEKNMENYYEYILSQLMYFTAKRRDIEQHFSAEKRTTYNFICDEQSRYAVALIKNGCKYSVNGGSVSIHLENGESITLYASEISSALDGEPSSAIEFLSKPTPEPQQGQTPSDIIKLPSRSSAVNEYELSSLKRKVEEYAWREEGFLGFIPAACHASAAGVRRPNHTFSGRWSRERSHHPMRWRVHDH